MTQKPSETVRVLHADPQAPGPLWEPKAGKQTNSVLKKVFGDPFSREALVVREEAIATLGNCLPPGSRLQSATGLVIGYVQSGKTLAFTVVTALARDSNFSLVIILAGTIVNLFDQSTGRLREDLSVSEGWGWKLFTSEDLKTSATTDKIGYYLREWSKEDQWTRRETVVITVLKQKDHLDRVADLIETLALNGVLRDCDALVIDDEADQAGLNTLVGKGKESATYKRIVRLRAALPQHTYLQYTATPQAILLISLMDQLSPSFVQVLTPGSSYTGAKDFFASEADLIRAIPDEDIELLEEEVDYPPPSLVEALETFLVAAAVGLIQQEEHRSMMVHPHRLTVYHQQCKEQIIQLRDRWRGEMSLPEDDEERLDLETQFRRRYDDLSNTQDELPSWSQMPAAIRHILSRGTLSVHELNRRSAKGSTKSVNWERERFTVLVGGQKLDRGYTVQGLVVTYMPRSRGVGNIDTIQQRARWFGYKEKYLGLCRVHLRDDVVRVYRKYIEHEENVRRELKRVVRDGGSIRDWRRSFFLDRTLRPTRSSVIGRKVIRGGRGGWFVTATPTREPGLVDQNRAIVSEAARSFETLLGAGNLEEEGAHNVAREVSLEWALREILVEWAVSDPVDSARLSATNLQLRWLLDHDPEATITLFFMRPHLAERGGGGSRRGGCSDDGTIETVFQGPSNNYLGDRNLVGSGEIAIQLHSIRLVTARKRELGSNIPVVAVHVPAAVSKDWLSEVVE